MPKEKYPTPEVNLMPEDTLLERPGGKFLQWALTWGKRIVVLTELIVLCAFFSRFYFDTVLADLTEKVNSNKNIVLADAQFEKDFRLLTDRISKAKRIESTTSQLTIYDRVREMVPAGTVLTGISVDNNKIGFAGSCSEAGLAELITNFRGSEDFKEITVNRVAKQGSALSVEFSFTAVYGKAAND